MSHRSARASLRGKQIISGAGVAALTVPFLLVTGAQATPFAPDDGLDAIRNSDYIASYPDEFRAQVNADTIWDHDHQLSVEIGPRVAGTAAEDAAADYVQGMFDQFGYDTERETFDTRSQNFANVTPSRYTDEYASWQFRPADNGRFTGPNDPVSGELIDVGDGSDLDDFDLDGKIVLADWVQNGGARNTLLTDIHAAGAEAAVLGVSSGSEALPRFTPLPEGLSDWVVVGSATNQTNRMRTLLEDGSLDLSITTEQSRADSTNVIGTIPAASGDAEAPIVYIGSHIDSVVGSPGASDNGSGASIMLEVARILSQYDLDVEIRAGAWGAEEIGIIGSHHHVDTLTQEEIDRAIGAWNMDMAGTSYEGTEDQPFDFWALTVDGASADENEVLRHANIVSNDIGDGDLNIGQVGRSDHQYFHDAGIDAAVFSWMFWAGGTNIVLEPAYHMTTDTLEFVSAERMGYAGQVLGSSAFLAALNEVTVDVVDENGEPAADVPVAMQCEGDEGWREVGTTDADGSATTHAPHISCDFVALADNGAEGSALDEGISGDTEVAIALMVDGEAPVVEISLDPEADADGVHDGSVLVTITAVDDNDPNPSIMVEVNGGGMLAYNGPFTLEDEGEYIITAQATDAWSNVGTAETEVTIELPPVDDGDGDKDDDKGEDEDSGGKDPADKGEGSAPGDKLEDTGVSAMTVPALAVAAGLLAIGATTLVVRRRMTAA